MADQQNLVTGGTSGDPNLTPVTGDTTFPNVQYAIVPDLAPWPASSSLASEGSLGVGGPYLGWGQTISIRVATGLALNAIQGAAGTPQDPVRIHGGKAMKVITGVAIRVGAHPAVPSPVSQSVNDVLVGQEVATFNRAPMPDGTPVYGVVWQFVYELQAPPAATDSYQFSRAPLDAGSPDALNPADFSNYMNSPVPPVTSAYAIPAVTF